MIAKMLAIGALAGVLFANSGQSPAVSETATSNGKATRMCQNSVEFLLRRTGYGHITFENSSPGDRAEHISLVHGTVSGQRGVTRQFSFSCSVDTSAGKVRDFDLNRK